MSMGHPLSSLAMPFPTLYFTFLWLFCNYLFVHFNPLILSPISPTSSSHLATIKMLSVSMILSVLVCLVCFLDWVVDRYVFVPFSFGPYFFVLTHLLGCKGWNLMYSPGQGNPGHCVVALYVGRDQREQYQLLCSLPAFSHFPCYPQANWALLRLITGWVGLCTF